MGHAANLGVRLLRLFVPGQELASRLGVTMLLIFLARVGHFVPIPDMNWQAASSNAAMEYIMGQTEVVANAFALGIAPLMSAYFFLASLNIIPSMRKHFAQLREEGSQGQDVYNVYATALFILFACWEGMSLARNWLPLRTAVGAAAGQAAGSAGAAVEAAGATVDAAAGFAAQAMKSSAGSGTIFVFLSVVFMVAGSAICKLITQLVDRRGLGDGVGLLIALGVAVNYGHFLRDAAQYLAVAPPAPWAMLGVAAMCTALVAAGLWAQSVELRVRITFYKQRRVRVQSRHPVAQLINPKPGRERQGEAEAGAPQDEDEGTQQHFIMRLSPSGARTLLFANFWTALLQPPLSWLGLGNPFQSALGFALLVVVVEGISFADMTPRQMSQYLSASAAGVVGLTPGDDTIAFFTARRQQLKLLNAVILAVLSLAARGVDNASVALLGVPAGSLSLLLLASTAASGARQVEALSRAPAIEGWVAREQHALGASRTRVITPESPWAEPRPA